MLNDTRVDLGEGWNLFWSTLAGMALQFATGNIEIQLEHSDCFEPLSEEERKYFGVCNRHRKVWSIRTSSGPVVVSKVVPNR